MLFPDDVVDHILSFLQSDHYTLKQCARSHSTLSNLSECHIYANVLLTSRNSPETNEFIKTLSRRPGIAKRSLAIHISFEEYLLASGPLCAIAYLLPTFSGLINFEIKAANGCFSWRDFPSTFRQPFLDFLHSQGKKKVSIFGARHFPLSLLNICKDVRVTLDKCEDTQYDEGASSKDVLLSYPVPFEHLSILRCSEKCLETIIAWPRMHSLRSLEYKIGWSRHEFKNFFRPMIVACSNSLTTLCLDINYYFEFGFHKFDQHSAFTLVGLCHLERLFVKAEIILPSRMVSIPAIVQLISTAFALPNFQELFLEFKFSNISSGPGTLLPLLPVVDTCSSLFIPVYVSEKFSPVITFCEELMPYVERGVVVLIPEIPTN